MVIGRGNGAGCVGVSEDDHAEGLSRGDLGAAESLDDDVVTVIADEYDEPLTWFIGDINCKVS